MIEVTGAHRKAAVIQSLAKLLSRQKRRRMWILGHLVEPPGLSAARFVLALPSKLPPARRLVWLLKPGAVPLASGLSRYLFF
jgi:hypothetical protein